MDLLDSTTSLTASTTNLVKQCWNSVIYHFKETEGIDGIKLDCNKTLLKKSAESLVYCSADVDDYNLSLQLLSWLTTPIIISFIVFIVFMYYCAIKPLNWTMGLSDVGYDFLNENKPKGSRQDKKLLVQQIRKLRQIGDLPPVYPNGWFALAESPEIKKSQVKYVAALGENFAVFRTKDGEIKILDAYCPHLGANMAVGGIVHGNCLECPFHGWKFDGDNGNCVEIPYSTSKVPGSAKVKNWKSCEVNEFIFVWYHAEDEEPSWQPEQIPQIKSGKWWYRGRNEFYINVHIQEIPENGADVSHLNAIHTPSMISGMDISKCNKSFFNFCKHKWSAKWSACQEPDKKHIGVMNLTHKMMLFDKITLINMDAKVSQVGPSYVELKLNTSFGTIVILQTITPIEPMLQKLTHRLYCPPYLVLYANLFLLGETVMVARDVMVWNHKKFIKNPLLVKEDQTIQLFRRWFSQFYSENSPKFTYKQDTMDW